MCISEEIFAKSEERSVIREVCSDRSMSFNVVSITGCPEVGKAAMDECRAWLLRRELKAWASICGMGGRCGGASILILALAGLFRRLSPSGG